MIINKIPHLRDKFFGIVDNFDASMKAITDGFWILFIDNDNKIGHYTCIYQKSNQLYFFDSRGRSPQDYGLKLQCQFNLNAYQTQDSCTCALFCIYFAHICTINMCNPFLIINSQFCSSNLWVNEHIVVRWIAQYHPTAQALLKCK